MVDPGTYRRLALGTAACGLLLLAAWWLLRTPEAPAPGPGADRTASDDAPTGTPALRGDAEPIARKDVGEVAPATPFIGVQREGPIRTVVLRILVDGRPSLPTKYSIRAGRDDFLRIGKVSSGPVEEDRAKAELRFRMRVAPNADEVDVWFHGEDGWPCEATARARADGSLFAELSTESAGFLVADLTPKGDRHLNVAKYSPESGRWGEAPAPPGYHGVGRVERDGVSMYGPLRAGRYCLVDHETGLMSDVADLPGGGPPVTLALDLSKAGRATGKIVIPETKAALAEQREMRLWVEGAGVLHFNAEGVGPDGSFSVSVPGDREVTIRPWHPVLVPAEGDGTVVVRAPRDGLVLRMVAGTWCSFRAAFPPQRPWLPPVRVLRFADEPRGAPLSEHSVTLREGGVARFGGYPAGTCTLWIDVHGFAPAVLRGVHLPEGSTDLGEVPLARGSAVRVRTLWNEPAEPPPVIVSARALDDPSYYRVVEQRPDPFVTLSGLGAGRLHVDVFDKGASRWKGADLVLDGEHDEDLTFDLR